MPAQSATGRNAVRSSPVGSASTVPAVRQAHGSLELDAAAAPDESEVGALEWRRHEADFARLIIGLSIAVATLALTALQPDAVRELSADLVLLVRRLPQTVAETLVGLVQLAAILLPVVGFVAVFRHGGARLVTTAAAGAAVAASAVVLLQGWLDRVAPPELFTTSSWITGSGFPSGAYLAGATAAAVVVLPVLRRPWRRAVVFTLAGLALMRVLTAAVIPFHVVTHLAIGGTVGAAVLVAFGAPARRLALGEVAQALAAAGTPVGRLREIADDRDRSRRFRTETPDGRTLVVTVLGVDERDADLLNRIIRALRFKGLDDDRPGWSQERVAQHEALCALAAGHAGATVLSLEAVTATQQGDGVLAFEAVPGAVRLDLLPTDEITDDVLRGVWRSVARLQRRRLAHRWLSPRHLQVLRTDGGVEVAIDGFRWSRLGADDARLRIDLAQVLVGLTGLVGAERAVAAAVAELGAERVAAVLPYLQAPLIPRDLRPILRDDATRDALVQTVVATTGAEEFELVELRRITAGGVVSLVGTAFLGYVALSFLSNWEAISAALGRTDWGLVPGVLLLSASTWVTGAMAMIGSTTVRLPFGETVRIMLAQTYLNRFTPANAGGMALRTRYLQRYGVDLTSAATSVGLTSAASGVAQVLLLVTFGLWVGTSGVTTDVDPPSAASIAVVVLVVSALVGLVFATPWGRRALAGRLRHLIGRAWQVIRGLLADPSKLAWLAAGSVLGKLVVIVAFTQCCRMVGVEQAFPVLALLYMTANTVASAAPTPGGVGAIEAALVLVLQSIGVTADDALAAVLLFRLATFWLPTIPSYLALVQLRRHSLA